MTMDWIKGQSLEFKGTEDSEDMLQMASVAMAGLLAVTATGNGVIQKAHRAETKLDEYYDYIRRTMFDILYHFDQTGEGLQNECDRENENAYQ